MAEAGRCSSVGTEDARSSMRSNGTVDVRRMCRWVGRMVAYFGVGVAYYKYVGSVSWDVLESVYFITLSVTTVGYGDVVPSTKSDKAFTIVYVTFGIVFVWSSVSDAAGALLRRYERWAQQRRARRDLEVEGLLREVWWCAAIVCTMLAGAGAMCLLERYSFVDGLFWAFQTMTTIGYGDLVVRHRAMKAFVIVYALFASMGLTYAVGRMVATASDLSLVRRKESLMRARLDRDLIRRLDRDGNGVDRAEFVVGMLIILGLVKDDDAAPWFDRFDELDSDRDGRLMANDVRLATRDESRTEQHPLLRRAAAFLFPVSPEDDLSDPLLADSAVTPEQGDGLDDVGLEHPDLPAAARPGALAPGEDATLWARRRPKT